MLTAIIARIARSSLRSAAKGLLEKEVWRTGVMCNANNRCFAALTDKCNLEVNHSAVGSKSKFKVPKEDIYLLDAIETETFAREEKDVTNFRLIESSPTIKKFYDFIVEASTNQNIDVVTEENKYFLVNELYDKLMNISHETLTALLELIYMNVRKNENIKEIENILRVEFDKRLRSIETVSNNDFKDAFAVASLLLCLFHKNAYAVVQKLIERTKPLLDTMDVADFCCLMMLVKSSRYPLRRDLQSAIEIKFMQILPQLTIKQCALICAAFFKARMKIIHLDLVEDLVNFVAVNDDLFSEENNIGLSCILKSLKKTHKNPYHDVFDRMLNKCKLYGDNLKLVSINHLCAMLTRNEHYRPDILDLSLSRLLSELKDARIKDIERIFLSLSFFNHSVPEELFSEIEAQVMKLSVDEGNNYELFPHHYESLLLHCVTLEIYPRRLVDLVFGENMEIRNSGEYENLMRYLAIHTCLSVEAPEMYKNVLSPQLIEKITNEMNQQQIEHGKKVTILNGWEKHLKSLFPGRVKTMKTLPFLSFPDLVVFNEQNQSIDPTNSVNKLVRNAACIVLLYHSTFADRGLRRLTGIHSMKIRLLRKLGYKVYCIPFYASFAKPSQFERFRVLRSNEWAFNRDTVLLHKREEI